MAYHSLANVTDLVVTWEIGYDVSGYVDVDPDNRFFDLFIDYIQVEAYPCDKTGNEDIDDFVEDPKELVR